MIYHFAMSTETITHKLIHKNILAISSMNVTRSVFVVHVKFYAILSDCSAELHFFCIVHNFVEMFSTMWQKKFFWTMMLSQVSSCDTCSDVVIVQYNRLFIRLQIYLLTITIQINTRKVQYVQLHWRPDKRKNTYHLWINCIIRWNVQMS